MKFNKVHEFDFSTGVEISPEYVKDMVDRMLEEIGKGANFVSTSTGNTFVSVTQDEEGYIDVNICTNYRREVYRKA